MGAFFFSRRFCSTGHCPRFLRTNETENTQMVAVRAVTAIGDLVAVSTCRVWVPLGSSTHGTWAGWWGTLEATELTWKTK